MRLTPCGSFAGLFKPKEDPEEPPKGGKKKALAKSKPPAPKGTKKLTESKKGTEKLAQKGTGKLVQKGTEKLTQKAGAERGTQKAGLQAPKLQLGLLGRDQKLVFVGGATGKVGSRVVR